MQSARLPSTTLEGWTRHLASRCIPAGTEPGEYPGCKCSGWTWLQSRTHLGLVPPSLVQLCDLRQCTCPFRASETASEFLSGLPGRLNGRMCLAWGGGHRVMVRGAHTASVFRNLRISRHQNGRPSSWARGVVLENPDVHGRLVLVLQT